VVVVVVVFLETGVLPGRCVGHQGKDGALPHVAGVGFTQAPHKLPA
jgi:hypothetical protein